MDGGRGPRVKCSRDTLDGFRPERVDADESTAHEKGSRTDPAEVRGASLARANRRGTGDLKGSRGQVRRPDRAHGSGARRPDVDVGRRGDGAYCAGAPTGELRRTNQAGFCPSARGAQAPERDADAVVAGIMRGPWPRPA